MVVSGQIAYGTIWKLKTMNWIRHGDEVGYLYLTLVDGFDALNCRLNEVKHVGPISFIVEMTCIVVAQKLRCLDAFG